MSKKKKTIWRLWAKALGDKSGKNDREADTVAWIRTFIFVSYLVTNVAIVANAVRHWNDGVNSYSQGTTTQFDPSVMESICNVHLH